ncbi:MAG: NADH-quinone oxidoreductase subunit N [Anaerolineaceae bacterium]|nr:NADH-quinone oxidoreductase subunit N [Anaerolineaceae bacterium]
MSNQDLYTLLPLTVLVVWGLVLLLVDQWVPGGRKGITALLAALGMSAALGLSLAQAGQNLTAFHGMATSDGFSVFLDVLFLGAGIAGVGLAYDYLKRMGIEKGEYYSLLIFTVSGMMLMASASDLIIVFLALELLSIPLYVLAGFARPRGESEEASLKYFLLGSFASGFVLYGVAMVYGATGFTGLRNIVDAVRNGTANPNLLLIGGALLLTGFGFKVAAVPFHMWTPDVYQGAPSAVTGFMSVGAKAAGFAALLRIFVVAFPSLAATLSQVAWVIAALTMVVGNVLAISQGNVKRLLAYSSIANAGYILMAFVAFGQQDVAHDAVAAALFYLVAYALTNFAAWAVVITLETAEGKGLNLSDYAGMGRKYPLLSAVMLVAMLSFTGVPPTVGFWGKFYLFRTAVEGGYVGLALIGLLTSVVSAYYYLRILVYMYMREGQPVARAETWVTLTGVLSAVGILIFSVMPGPLFTWATQAVLRLF